MSFLIDSRIKKYDLLAIQKSWRNACVSTFYNSFNFDFHLLYEDIENVRIYFYVNTRIHVDHWFVDYVFDDVCIIRIKIANEKWINVHNVYNASLNFYASRSSLTIIEIIKTRLNDDEKHILLKDFNLLHSLWIDATRSIQHDAANQFLNVVQQTQLRFALFAIIIIWQTRHFQSTIDLIFMTKKLQQRLIHCMIRLEMNQSSNHISIFTKLMLIVKKNESRRRRAWKNINSNKFIDIWREFVASSSLSSVTQIEDYALQIQRLILSSIKSTISWTRFSFEIKLFWNEKCAKAITTTKRRRREGSTLHIEKFNIIICEHQIKRNQS
jgi:hypothetical protein